MNKIINVIYDKIKKDEILNFDEAKEILNLDLDELYKITNEINFRYFKNKVELCGIINAKSGACSEDCKFCAQSSYYDTGIETYKLLDKEMVLNEALKSEKIGIKCFSIVTSGNSLSSDEFKKICDIYKLLSDKTKLSLAASLGSISYIQAYTLKQMGVTRYHHNVETSKSFYSNICSTHSYDDRVKTIRNIKCAGFEVCSGGIIGIGETIEQRIEMAIELRNMEVDSIPINILNPIKGTPLENAPKISSDEIIRSIAIFRIINPKAYIRYAAGRNQLGEKQSEGFKAGVNAMMIGNFLTTTGLDIKDDMEMLNKLGLEIE